METPPHKKIHLWKPKSKKRKYACRDSNSGFPACEAGVITRLDHTRTPRQPWRVRCRNPHLHCDQKKENSPTGIRTRVVWVKTTYPDQLDYWGGCAGRESNPGLVRGRDVYYHCTTGASHTNAGTHERAFSKMRVQNTHAQT